MIALCIVKGADQGKPVRFLALEPLPHMKSMVPTDYIMPGDSLFIGTEDDAKVDYGADRMTRLKRLFIGEVSQEGVSLRDEVRVNTDLNGNDKAIFYIWRNLWSQPLPLRPEAPEQMSGRNNNIGSIIIT